MKAASLRAGRRLVGLGIAILLLWVVYQTVPWKDRLLVTATKGGEVAQWEGHLVGTWKAEEVEFTVQAPPSKEQAPLADLAVGTTVAATERELRWEGQVLGAHSIEWRPGLPTVFQELRWGALLPALALLLASSLAIITRWSLLLAAAGCATRWVQVFRITYVGLFFNLVLPGMSGGDLARAYWMVKGHPERRAPALMSVFMDRLLGLFAMALLATIAIFTNDERFAALRWPVLAVTGAMFLGGLVLLHPWLRQHLPVHQILDRLPASEKLHSLDRALRHYGHRPGVVAVAIVLSMINHLGASGALYVLGHALGDTHSFHDYICIATVMNTLSAVPISPGGLGVGEVLAGSLMRVAGGSYTLGVAASITYRIGLVVLGLIGGLILLLPGGAAIRQHWREAEAELGGAPPPTPAA